MCDFVPRDRCGQWHSLRTCCVTLGANPLSRSNLEMSFDIFSPFFLKCTAVWQQQVPKSCQEIPQFLSLPSALTKLQGVCHQLRDKGNSCLLGKTCRAGVQKFLFSLNILLLSSPFSRFHLLSQAWWALDSLGKRADLARKARTVRSESLSLLIGRLREEFT